MIVGEDPSLLDDVTIRILEEAPPRATFERLAQLMAQAYPVMGVDSPEKLATLMQNLSEHMQASNAHWVVAESGGELVGAMRLYDFTMNVRGSDASTGGVGSVAVALAHKRRGIARALIAWYLQYYRRQGAVFAVLHAFRPDFYRTLGFGYGTPMHRYRFSPAALRGEGACGVVRQLGVADLDALIACTERVRAQTNGLIAKHPATTKRLLSEQNVRYVGAFDSETLRAFMQTSVALGEAGRANHHTLVVREVHAEDDAAFAALLGYLSAQRDQFASIAIESQDDAFFLAATDPRDGSDVVIAPPAAHRIAETGLGIMYRLLDVPQGFAHLGPVDSPFALRLEVEDAFFGPTNGRWTFRFAPDAAPQLAASLEPDATLRVGSADLASLVVGSLALRSLIRHRLATLEPVSMLLRIDRAFRADAPPFCHTRF